MDDNLAKYAAALQKEVNKLVRAAARDRIEMDAIKRENKSLKLQLRGRYTEGAAGVTLEEKRNIVHRILGATYFDDLNFLWRNGWVKPNTKRLYHISHRRDREITGALDTVGIKYFLKNTSPRDAVGAWQIELI